MNSGIRTTLMALLLIGAVSPAIAADKAEKREQKRNKIDAMAADVLSELFDKRPNSKELYSKAYGYAVFDNLKLSLMFAGGRGSGVAIEKDSEKRTYMKMNTFGLNIGLGVQKMQVVFLFQNKTTFDRFVNKGWKVDASANAAIAKSGANLDAQFVNGMAVYQFTDKGLMLQADISGTKYRKNKKLNNN